MRTRFLPVWFLAVALIGVGWWQGSHDAARAATYYVTNNLDDGSANTLRGAINSATDGDEVHIVTPGPIVLTAGQLNITKSITIEGPDILVDPTKDPTSDTPDNTGQVAIEGISPNGSVFSIAAGKSVSMSHLFITGGTIAGPSHATGTGDDGFGAGINNTGNLTLNYCTVANNSTFGGDGPDGGGSAYGGGIYSSGTLTLNYCTVKNNLAQGGTGANPGGTLNAAYGGGIYSTGTTNINSSYIADNNAFGGGNASTPPVLATTKGGSAYGGGLAQKGSGTLNLTNSTVYDNFATSGTGSGANGDAQGGGVYVNTASFNPLQVTIANNTVTGTNTAGSGAYYSNSTALDVDNSVIANNNNANDLDATPSFVAHNSPGINVVVSLSSPSADAFSPTYALQSTDTTYVVDQGDNTLATSLSYDQRGYARKTGLRVDAGAVESASLTPVHNGATNLSPFYFHVINGATYFKSGDFTSSLTYQDPNTSLKAIIITQIPDPSEGYFQLNGQTLLKGSVISVDDLNNLTYVSNNGSDSAELYWQASDGSTVSTVIESETPRWLQPTSRFLGGTNGDGNTRPSLNLYGLTHTGVNTYTITAAVGSTAVQSGQLEITVTAQGEGVHPPSPGIFTASSPATQVTGNSTVTVNALPSTVNNLVIVTAKDVNGNTTVQQMAFNTDAAGEVSGVPVLDYGGDNGNGYNAPYLSVSLDFNSGLITADGTYTISAYASSGATLNNAAKVIISSNVGTPSDTTFTGTGSAAGTATISFPLQSGTHAVTISATDILGQRTIYRFVYKGDARPDIDESAIANAVHVPFGTTYSQVFTANDGDFYVPDTSISPEPLRFQVDQEGYAPSVSDTIDYNLKRGNVGTFGASNYTGNASTNTTLTTTYYLETGLGKTISEPGVYALRVSLTDYWGLGKTFVYTVIVDPPTAPVWNGPGNVVAQYNDPSFHLDLNDYLTGVYQGATPTFSVISGLPSWADFNPATGVISGTPNPTGTSHVAVSVNDGLGNVVPNSFDIQVVNGAPIVDSLTPAGGSAVTPPEGSTINFTVGDPLDIAVAAHDPNGDTPITYGLTGWSAASITKIDDNNATISSSGNLGVGDQGSHPVTLTVSDGTNTTTVNFTIKVTNGNAPVIDKSGILSTYNKQIGSTFTLPLMATDADPGDTLTFSVSPSVGTITPGSAGGPPGTTQSATYEIASVPSGSNTITITVTDNNGNQDMVTFTVNGGTGSAPSISLTSAGPFSAVTGVPIPTIKATATDADNPEDLTFTLSGAPSGMTLSSPSSFTGVTGSGDPKSVTLQWTPTTAQAGSYTFNVVVTDSQGFQDSVPVTIYVAASTVNHNPNVVNPGTWTGFVGVPFNKQIVATDPDGDNIVSYTSTTLPPGLSIDTSTGIISGTPTTVGTYNNVKVDVTDDSPLGAGTTTVTFSIVITNVNPPILKRDGSYAFNSPYTVAPGASFVKSLQAHDADYPETLTFSASYTDDNGATVIPLSNVWSTFNQSGSAAAGTTASVTFSWNNVPAGVHVVTVKAEDAAGNSDQETFTVQSGNAPQLTISPANSVTVLAGNAMPTITAAAKDADSNENLSFTLDGAPAGMTLGSPSYFSNVPANTTTNPVAVQWTPTAGDVGTHTFNIIVTDKDGLQATQSVTVTVTLPGVPTLSSVSGPLTVHVGDVIPPILLNSTDTDSGDTANFAVTISPSGLTGTLTPQSYSAGPPTTASTSLQLTASAIGNYRVDATVTDGQSHTATTTFYVNVVNAPPVIAPIADQSVSVGDSVNTQVNATDVDTGDTLTYELVNGPNWLSIDNSGLITSAVVTAGQVGTYPVTVSVDDGNSHVVTGSFTLTVSNQGVPTLSSVAGPITLHVGDEFTHTFTATDSDAGDTLTFNAQTSKFNSGTASWDPYSAAPLINQTYENGPPTTASGLLVWQAAEIGNYRVDVTVSDSQGHQTVVKFYINVVNGPPVIDPIANQSASIGNTVSVQVNATDPDGDTLNYQLVNSPSWLSINSSGLITSGPITASQVGTYSVTVSVDDGVNPAVTATFTLTVSNQGVPVLSSAKDLSQAVTVHVNESFTDLFTAQDSDAGDHLAFTVDTLQNGNPVTVNPSPTMQDQSYDGGPPVKATSLLTWQSDTEGHYQVNVSVTDDQSHKVTQTFYVNVIPNVPAPTISNPGTWFASVGGFSTTSVPPANNSEDTSNWQWTSSNLPAWVTLDKDTGILSGTPGAGDVGTTSVTVSVNDGVNPPVSVTFDIDVSNRGVPTLSATPTPLASPEECLTGSGYSRLFVSQDTDYPENLVFGVKVTDASGTVLFDEVSTDPNSHIRRIYQSGSLDLGGTTAGAEFDWTPPAGGIYQVDVSVKDQQGHVTSLSYSIRVSSPPTIQVNNTTAPVTINATPELPITPIPVQVSDPDDHETLTVTLDSNAPSGMTVKSPSTFSNVAGGTPQNTELDFTPTTDQANQSFTFNVTATDSAGLTATQQVTVNVGAVNARPVISSPTANSSVNVVTGHAVSLPVIATDAEGDTLTFAATGLPTGLTIDSSTGIISGTVTAAPGTNTVTVTVDDGYHISPAASVTFKIVVGSTNHNPTLSAISDQTLVMGQSLNVQASGSDPDHDSLTYSMTGNPAWVSIDPSTGLITIPDTTQESEGSWNITVTVDDGYGGTASQSFALVVHGAFSVSNSVNNGYLTVVYTVTNTTGSTISPVVRGSLTGAGYTDNADALFYASQGSESDTWASPKIQRDLDPTKSTRLISWNVGSLAAGASASLTIYVPIKSSVPNGTELTSIWTMDYGSTERTVTPVLSN